MSSIPTDLSMLRLLQISVIIDGIFVVGMFVYILEMSNEASLVFELYGAMLLISDIRCMEFFTLKV